MDAPKRYWRSLDRTSRRSLLLLLAVDVMRAAWQFAWLVVPAFSVSDGEPGDVSWPPFYAFVTMALLLACQCALAYRAFRAIRGRLFERGAPGYPARESWTQRDDGLLMGAVLSGGTFLGNIFLLVPSVARGGPSLSMAPMAFWVLAAFFLVPRAARRFMPLDDEG